MDNNDKCKKSDIKNRICYYFDEIVKISDFNLDHILTDEKLCESILVYSISCKS